MKSNGFRYHRSDGTSCIYNQKLKEKVIELKTLKKQKTNDNFLPFGWYTFEYPSWYTFRYH